MAATNQICQLDTITLARAVAAKELSPVEAVEAVLERLDRLARRSTCWHRRAGPGHGGRQADRGRHRRRA